MQWSEKLRVFACLCVLMTLSACGDDSGTSANDDLSSSSVTLSGRSSGTVIPDSVPGSASSSSKKAESSSGQKAVSSSSVKKESSSSVIPDSVPGSVSSSSKTDSGTSAGMTSSSNTPSSSSEYVPFDHSWTLANVSKVGEDAYHQFTDPRNGRSYYYITITSDYLGKSVTVMAENLNIGEMVLGTDNQNDDTKIERYCYNNDTTKCDEFGGLYQWAEVMQLPSRCNTESCSDLIKPNHQGICPDGWRLFTWDDYVVVSDYKDDFNDGVKGLRSTYGFLGTNQSGFSLTGVGRRTVGGKFLDLKETVFWFYPQEHEYGISVYAYAAYVSASSDDGTGTSSTRRAEKQTGRSVRCTKLE